jgi:hypothetical protein
MDVILMERVGKLGHIGDTVRVKDGYARNFLLPRGKALRATEANKKKFEGRRADLEARNAELKRSASEVSDKLDGVTVVIVRQAGETGQLYGSMSRSSSRSRRLACTRSPFTCIPRSSRRSPSTSRARPSRPNDRRRARTSRCASRPRWTTLGLKSAERWPRPGRTPASSSEDARTGARTNLRGLTISSA